jgi:hypothetical protein
MEARQYRVAKVQESDQPRLDECFVRPQGVGRRPLTKAKNFGYSFAYDQLPSAHAAYCPIGDRRRESK